MVNQPLNIDYDDWSKIILNLTAFCKIQVSTYKWNNGIPRGLTLEDFVMETICRFLEKPEKFDPEKGDLLKYLKYYILRQLISNAFASSDNKELVNIEFFALQEENDKFDFDYGLPVIQNTIENDIDFAQLQKSILAELNSQSELEDIYLYIESGYTRSETCQELKIEPNEYTNRLKRLKRLLIKLINNFHTIKK